jgi:hypothetical protein
VYLFKKIKSEIEAVPGKRIMGITMRSFRLSNMEAYVGNKATIMLIGDLNARSHEITLRVFVLVSVFPVDVSVVFLFYLLI